MIEIENITKRFGEKTAVSGLSITVPPGEFFAFLGPNGAGKTTTIKMITGLLRPDSGRVCVCGSDVVQEPVAAKANLSYVPDQPHLYDKLTGREFLSFIGRMYRIEPEQMQFKMDYLADVLSLHEFMDQLAEEYSHGMKQRMVIAGALMHDPNVIVVDEPMVGLDPKSARVVKDLLRDLSNDGVAVFMSTHTLAVAEELADQIAIISHGKLVAHGTIEELHEVSGGETGLEESFLRLTAEEETA